MRDLDAGAPPARRTGAKGVIQGPARHAIGPILPFPTGLTILDQHARSRQALCAERRHRDRCATA